MATEMHGPTSHSYISQRLRLHYVDWGNEDAPPMLLVHGGQDHCRNWDWVARDLRQDYHVIAPDLRGHGDSEWARGSTYPQHDYVYDIAQLLYQKQLFPIRIIGHSLGGSIALRYAGIFPENVEKLVSIEGFGPPPEMAQEWNQSDPAIRLRGWIESGRKMAGRTPRRYPKLEDAFRRMQEENPHLSEDQARHLTIHGVNQNEDGTFSWKFDNYARSRRAERYDAEEAERLFKQITCPTLLITGKESWAVSPEQSGLINCFKDVRSVLVNHAGHWVHHDQLDLVLRELRAFLV